MTLCWLRESGLHAGVVEVGPFYCVVALTLGAHLYGTMVSRELRAHQTGLIEVAFTGKWLGVGQILHAFPYYTEKRF